MSTNLLELSGTIALVPGARRGIGEKVGRLLAEQTAHVIVSSSTCNDCRAVAETSNYTSDECIVVDGGISAC
jgi:NAD(P)-dependent dehydrogenase (short-subunit alcohol dehydrogenase family)